MVFKMSCFLLTLGLLTPVWGSPALDDKQQFCVLIVKNATNGHVAKTKLHMSDEEFRARAQQYFIQLLNSGVAEHLVGQLMEAILVGWNSKELSEQAIETLFKECMIRENV